MTYGGVKKLLGPFYEAQFPMARVVTKLPADLQAQVPLIQVVGISDLPHPKVPKRFRRIRWVLQTFAAGDVAGEDFANQVSTVTTSLLCGAPLVDADVTSVVQDSGPSWVPYPDTQVTQYAAGFNGVLLLR